MEQTGRAAAGRARPRQAGSGSAESSWSWFRDAAEDEPTAEILPGPINPGSAGRGPTDRPPAVPSRPRRKLPFWVELPILVMVALMLTFLIQTFVARVYVIPSGSMEQTLDGHDGVGDRILVDKVVFDFHAPRPGDVVVFKAPSGWDQ